MSTLPQPPGSTPETGESTFPTPRTLLTSLLNSISSIPLVPIPNTDNFNTPTRHHPMSEGIHDGQFQQQGNPLRRVPASHRPLIITLHVLFPGLVLPALDLLERGLVSRVALDGHHAGGHRDGNASGDGGAIGNGGGGGVKTGAVVGDGGGGATHEAGTTEKRQQQQEKRGNGKGNGRHGGNAFYLVTSSSAAVSGVESGREGWQRQRRRKRNGEADSEEGGIEGATRKGYIVRLDAWHCSCAAFAFAAVQGEGMGPTWGGDTSSMGILTEGTGTETGPAWSFGGTSLDGLVPGCGVSVCKHLLACLLADRWDVALGQYVIERRVAKQEMAGIIADV